MLECFFPHKYVKSIYELPVEELKRKGIKALVFDIDNTVVPFDVAEADDDIVDLLKEYKKQGFKICLFSNNNKKRVQLFNKKIKALAVYRAGKPGTKKLKRAMEKMGTDPKSTAIIGDQLFTDVFCGNRANMMTILTAPICERDQLVTKMKRGIERIVLNKYMKRSEENGLH